MNNIPMPRPWPDKNREALDKTRQDVNRHRYIVAHIMSALSMDLARRGQAHDITKRRYVIKWHAQLDYYKRTGNWESGWLEEVHAKAERHHLDIVVPPKVTLLDVFEYIIDHAVSQTSADSGPHELKLDCNVLEQAVSNTVETVLAMLSEGNYEKR